MSINSIIYYENNVSREFQIRMSKNLIMEHERKWKKDQKLYENFPRQINFGVNYTILHRKAQESVL